MEKITQTSLFLFLSLISISTFANITVTNYPSGIDPYQHVYWGNIQSASYNGNQSVDVVLSVTGNNYPPVTSLTLTFDGDDLAFGGAISSLVGSIYQVSFYDYKVGSFAVSLEFDNNELKKQRMNATQTSTQTPTPTPTPQQ